MNNLKIQLIALLLLLGMIQVNGQIQNFGVMVGVQNYNSKFSRSVTNLNVGGDVNFRINKKFSYGAGIRFEKSELQSDLVSDGGLISPNVLSSNPMDNDLEMIEILELGSSTSFNSKSSVVIEIPILFSYRILNGIIFVNTGAGINYELQLGSRKETKVNPMLRLETGINISSNYSVGASYNRYFNLRNNRADFHVNQIYGFEFNIRYNI